MYIENRSLMNLKAAQVASLELTSPFFAAVFGLLLIGENVTYIQIIGMITLIFGVYFLSKHEEIT